MKEWFSNYFEIYILVFVNIGSCKLKSVDIDFEGRKLFIYVFESFVY